MGLNELREKFLSFFESKGHLRHESFPLLPQSDSSLLLINSGMAPLKPYFSGEVTPPRTRMTTCQKCVRTPDIERVGKTSRHGTFFEMLGNFSFGDYFKHEATAWAWEFITKELKIPEELLYVSVYLDDDETYDIWTKEIGVDPKHMVRLGKEDNFWEIGAGPCGPCSEIYFDRGEAAGCGKPDCHVGCDCDRYVEFWNLVFSQFNNDGNGNYSPLKQKNIDTGMGLERIACIMQGVNNLFEVDTIQNIMKHVSRVAGVNYGDSEKTDVSLRIITDHIRSTTMLISDGILPSNEGRGYVLRRLLRRAARHGRLIGIKGPFLYQICDTVIHESGNAYPELVAKQEFIKRVITMEEESFERTIDGGLSILNDEISAIKAANGTVLPGETAFRLYDTFGFPIDLTLEITDEAGLDIDRDGFDKLMNEQRERARAARAALGDHAWERVDFGLSPKIKTEFLGYTTLESKAKVLALASDGAVKETVGEGDEVNIILDVSPFYAEMGGQVADHGTISSESGKIRITDVRKLPDGKFAHVGTVEAGSVSVGDTVNASVCPTRRGAIMRAHSATHLLQKSLRTVLGTHVEQAGSYVDEDTLRFDFTHFAAMTADEIAEVERLTNEAILKGMEITCTEMPIEEAKKLGAMALFGEKYGDIVRVVRMGDYSTEFCGGTHLNNTAKAGLIRIVSESSVAAGVRRIEAVTGTKVFARLVEAEQELGEVSASLKTSPAELPRRITVLQNELRDVKRELETVKSKAAAGGADELLASAKEIGGLKVISVKIDADTAALRTMGDTLRSKEAKLVAVLAAEADGKLTFCASCGADAVKAGVKAGDLVRSVAQITGGNGGGKPDSAMAGGKDATKLNEALASVESFVAEKVK